MELKLRTAQVFLCIFNITLLVTGVIVICQVSLQNQDYANQTGYKNLKHIHYVTTVIGILWCITGATVLYGILRIGPFLVLSAYLLGLVIIAFLMERIVYLNFMKYYVKDDIKEEMDSAVRHIENGYNQSDFVYSYPVGDWIVADYHNECCGLYGIIPKMCCKNTYNCTFEHDSVFMYTGYPEGCINKVYEKALNKIYGTIVLTFLAFVGQILALVCTLWVLLFSIEHTPIQAVPR